MFEQPLRSSETINLANANILLVDGHRQGLAILTELFAGFGAHAVQTATDGEAAMDLVRAQEFNLLVVDSALADMDGYQFIRTLRRSGVAPNCFAPVLLLTGHTQRSQVVKARDCGANFVVCKPVSALVMLQRILWISRENRQFVDAPNYCGPDRRFCALGPPPGEKGRRKDDLSAELGRATEPNLGQDDIDALFNVKKASA